MKYEEIMRLLDAGYSRDEILQMETETQKEIPQEKDSSSKTPEEEFSAVIQEMRDAFAEMRKEFTAFNIMNSKLPEEDMRSGEDAIASIINPTKKKNGGK